MFRGYVASGPKGFISMVSNDRDTTYEIHPMGEIKNREFTSESAARGLAEGHARHINNGIEKLSSSWVRV